MTTYENHLSPIGFPIQTIVAGHIMHRYWRPNESITSERAFLEFPAVQFFQIKIELEYILR